jgi:fumarylacetoacetate (FAA) hydrolase
MKLATLSDGSRDGQLVVVSRDLAQAHFASGIATRLQQVLDDWGFLAPQLEELSIALNHGRLRHAFAFEPERCLAPLPRAFGLALPEGLRASDHLLGATAPLRVAGEGLSARARLAAVHGDLNRGADAAAALDALRLVLLMADSGASTAFAPVAVTPEELGEAWQAGRIALPLQAMHKGRRVEAPELPDPGLGERLASEAATRALRAGGIVASTARVEVGPLAIGDALRFEIKGTDGQSVFGAIEQDVTELA